MGKNRWGNRLVVTLVFPNSLRTELEHKVIQGYPHETCGLLLGDRTNSGGAIKQIVSARNLNEGRTKDRFLLDPKDFLQADQTARSAGWEVLGIWHSHPDHPAEPSNTDLDNAWPDWSYVIASVSRQGVQAVRSWRLQNNVFVEEVIQA